MHGEVLPEGDAHLVVRDSILDEVPDVRVLPRGLLLPLCDKLGMQRLISFVLFELYRDPGASLVDPVHHVVGECEVRAERLELELVKALLLVVVTLHDVALEVLPEDGLHGE